MQDDVLLKQIIRRLDILIALQLETVGGPEAAQTAGKIRRLSELGLSPSEVAAVVGKPPKYVSATLSTHKKRAKRKAAKK